MPPPQAFLADEDTEFVLSVSGVDRWDDPEAPLGAMLRLGDYLFECYVTPTWSVQVCNGQIGAWGLGFGVQGLGFGVWCVEGCVRSRDPH